MQCFQKDPNLRVSARKLLKHPWIVNAKRSDAVVPKKPTEYDEAVKSVQEWNEALKSPNAGSLRRASRPLSSSPIPGRREALHATASPAKGPLNLAKPKVNTDQFRSPSTMADDNWDDDFDTAISPRALQLPHLKPQDNFGGLLSSEKLKQFASFATVTEEANWNDNFEGDLTVKNQSQMSHSDPLETIRPSQARYAESKPSESSSSSSPEQKRQSKATRGSAILPTVHQSKPPIPAKQLLASTSSYAESEEEDYSDLIADDETTFDVKFGIKKVLFMTSIRRILVLRLLDSPKAIPPVRHVGACQINAIYESWRQLESELFLDFQTAYNEEDEIVCRDSAVRGG